MKPRIIFIHGNQTSHWSSGFSPWLKENLEKAGYPVFFETFPDSILARADYWIPFLKYHVHASENDVIVGWSSGAVAAMRYAEENKILGSVLISGNHTDLNDDMEKQSGYYDKPWKWDAIKSNQKKIALFFGDNDPYIPQEEFEYIAGKLNAEKHKVHGAGHFEDFTKFPELLEYILKNF